MAQRNARDLAQGARRLPGVGAERFRNPHGEGAFVTTPSARSREVYNENANFRKSQLPAPPKKANYKERSQKYSRKYNKGITQNMSRLPTPEKIHELPPPLNGAVSPGMEDPAFERFNLVRPPAGFSGSGSQNAFSVAACPMAV